MNDTILIVVKNAKTTPRTPPITRLIINHFRIFLNMIYNNTNLVNHKI